MSLGTENIKSVLTDILDIVETTIDVNADGKVSFIEYPKLAGSIASNAFTIMKDISSAIEEAKDLTEKEINEIIEHFVSRASMLFKFEGTNEDLGTQAIEAGVENIKDIFVILWNAIKDGVQITDAAEVPAVIFKLSEFITNIKKMFAEVKDLNLAEGVLLLTVIAREIVEALVQISKSK